MKCIVPLPTKFSGFASFDCQRSIFKITAHPSQNITNSHSCGFIVSSKKAAVPQDDHSSSCKPVASRFKARDSPDLMLLGKPFNAVN